MERGERRAVADRHDSRGREPLLQQMVERGLGGLIERGRGLVEEQEVRRVQQCAGDAQPLLLAERQHAVPMRLLLDPFGKGRQADRGHQFGDFGRIESPRLRRIGDRGG